MSDQYLLEKSFKVPNRASVSSPGASYSTEESRYSKSFVSGNWYLVWAKTVSLQDLSSYNQQRGSVE